MNLEVKNVKVGKGFETPNFNAKIYQDGKYIADAFNDGNGGSTSIYPADGYTYKDVEHLADLDTEAKIFELVETLSFVKSKQSNHLVLKKGEDIFTKKLNVSVARYKKSLDGMNILNKAIADLKKDGYEILNTNI